MKKYASLLNIILTGVLVLIVAASILPNFRVQAQTPDSTPTPQTVQPACDPSRTISVSGTAVVNVVPDRVLIQLGVQSNGKSPAAVQAINADTIERVVKTVRALGVEARDISTDWYVIEPLYEDYDSLRIKGYRINNMVAITLREVGKVNDVITAAMQAGANQVINVELYTSELRKYRDQARELAVRAAVEKAAALTAAAGTATGCVLNINENVWSYYNGWGYGGYNSGRFQNIWSQNVTQNAAPASGGDAGALSEAGPVSLGQISVRAEVSISFSLK